MCENKTRASMRTRRFLNQGPDSLGWGPCVTVYPSCTSRSPKKIHRASRLLHHRPSIQLSLCYYQRLNFAHPSVGARTPGGKVVYRYIPYASTINYGLYGVSTYFVRRNLFLRRWLYLLMFCNWWFILEFFMNESDRSKLREMLWKVERRNVADQSGCRKMTAELDHSVRSSTHAHS